MTHDEILKAACERIAAIDKQTADLAAERAKLVAMVAAPPPAPSFPLTSPHTWQIDPLGTQIITGTSFSCGPGALSTA